ncbi:transposase [Paraburkholderia bryophila]|uniref:Transposase n=1 Tax=Paraburkholderia bryophila TaxID=420952 RepID=A0A7Z0B9B2_9BURK|nr:transposase [Paraburkholderia bryophila]NYH26511.1 transposase [Paraburkholderia bryophila]
MNTLASNLTAPAVHDLTDEQWHRIVPLLPEMKEHGPRRGRPSIDIRRVMNSVMWVLRTRAPWSAMPERYAPYQTAHRYYLRWKKSGVLADIAFTLFGSDAMLERPLTRRSDVRAAQIAAEIDYFVG